LILKRENPIMMNLQTATQPQPVAFGAPLQTPGMVMPTTTSNSK